MHVLQEILENTGYECYATSPPELAGRPCLAVTTDRTVGVIFGDVLAYIADHHLRSCLDLAEAFDGMRTDALGRGTVVYFPTVAYEADE